MGPHLIVPIQPGIQVGLAETLLSSLLGCTVKVPLYPHQHISLNGIPDSPYLRFVLVQSYAAVTSGGLESAITKWQVYSEPSPNLRRERRLLRKGKAV